VDIREVNSPRLRRALAVEYLTQKFRLGCDHSPRCMVMIVVSGEGGGASYSFPPYPGHALEPAADYIPVFHFSSHAYPSRYHLVLRTSRPGARRYDTDAGRDMHVPRVGHQYEMSASRLGYALSPFFSFL
jgi:hypothetical protein